jgi:hypothetical protein
MLGWIWNAMCYHADQIAEDIMFGENIVASCSETISELTLERLVGLLRKVAPAGSPPPPKDADDLNAIHDHYTTVDGFEQKEFLRLLMQCWADEIVLTPGSWGGDMEHCLMLFLTQSSLFNVTATVPPIHHWAFKRFKLPFAVTEPLVSPMLEIPQTSRDLEDNAFLRYFGANDQLLSKINSRVIIIGLETDGHYVEFRPHPACDWKRFRRELAEKGEATLHTIEDASAPHETLLPVSPPAEATQEDAAKDRVQEEKTSDGERKKNRAQRLEEAVDYLVESGISRADAEAARAASGLIAEDQAASDAIAADHRAKNVVTQQEEKSSQSDTMLMWAGPPNHTSMLLEE